MAFQFTQKKEKTMAFILKERVEYVIDPVQGNMRVATAADKGGRFLLGVAGSVIDMTVAVKLGLVKAEPEKAEVKDEVEPKPKSKKSKDKE